MYAYHCYFFGNATRPHGVPQVIPVPARATAESSTDAVRRVAATGGAPDGPMGGLASVLGSGAGLMFCVFMWMRSWRGMVARRKAAAARGSAS